LFVSAVTHVQTPLGNYESVDFSSVVRGASGGTRPGAQALGAHQHTFCKHLKTRFKQIFIPKCA